MTQSGHWADQHLQPVVRRFSLAGDTAPNVHSFEHAVALQIDDLLGLRDCKGNRIIAVLMRVCPNEPMLFRAVGEVLLDDSRGLIVPLRSVRGRPNAVALVFDRRRVRLVRLAGRSPAGYAGPRSFKFRKHGPRPSLGSTGDYHAGLQRRMSAFGGKADSAP
jgi:hypothetical protein